MNEIQRGVMILLKSAITGQAMQMPDGFTLDEAFPLIKAHQMIPIIYEGAVCCGISPKTPIMRQMLQGYTRCTLISEAQMAVLGQIFEAFDNNGIDYMPMKGCNMKALFPKPEMRMMADADVLIRMEQYEKIKPILAQLGLKETGESDHELVWHSNKLHLELHKRLVPSFHKDFCAHFADGWSLARKVEGSRYCMSAEDEFVYLFTHYAKHYRAGGIGCRHVVDLWIYRRAHTDMDEKYICDVMEKIQLREFYENTNKLIRFWFEDGAGDEKTEFMSEYIFSSGSWGNMESRVLSIHAQNAKVTGTIEGSRSKTLWQTIFPSTSKLQYSYPVLKKAPWLTPVFWPVRWVGTLLFRRERIRNKSAALKTATADRIENYQQSLQYVGLDFHYEE